MLKPYVLKVWCLPTPIPLPCSPTRATMMTGQYGVHTGVGAVIPRNGSNGLSATAESLFDILEDTDYSTNLLGKWHLAGGEATLDHPAELGVSDYFGIFKGGIPNYSSWTAVQAGAEVNVEAYSTTEITNRAINWIGAQESPWFLWLAYNAPHAPFHLPPSELHSFDDLPNDKDAIDAAPLPYYQAMLESLDTEIGRLVGSLSPEALEDTVIVFLGDNGSPNQVTRGFYGDHAAKGTIYEGGTHVPFVVAGPGIQTGRTDGFVNTTDLFATIAGYAGIDEQTAESHDFRPLLSGETGTRDYIYVEHFSEEAPKRSDVFGWALREGAYKLVAEKGEAVELYNLDNDPLEAEDLLVDGVSDGEAKIVAQIEARASEIRSE